MGNIIDVSEHQPDIKGILANNKIDLLIARVQYGSLKADCKYQQHIADAKAANVPFNTYAFPEFISVEDARVEARDAWNRSDKDGKVIWLDVESEYYNGKPAGITKLSQQVRLDGIKAYVDELRKQGAQKVGGYIAHNVYEAWAINTIVDIFDAVWIPRYGINDGTQQTKPKYPCDLWQFTSTGKLAGYDGNLDMNVLIDGGKPLEWFTEAQQEQQQAVQPSGFIMTVRAIGEGDIRAEPSHTAGFIKNTKDGELFNVIRIQNDWHLVAISDTETGWIDGNHGQNLYWVNNPALQAQVTPQGKTYHTVMSGDTVSLLAKKYGSSVQNIKLWNGLNNSYLIRVGQRLRVK